MKNVSIKFKTLAVSVILVGCVSGAQSQQKKQAAKSR
jgi:hypothetical protein